MKKSVVLLLSLFVLLTGIFLIACDEEKPNDDGNLNPTPQVTTHTVTFNSNGGSEVPTQTVENGKNATKPATPTKTGYSFDGWYVGDEQWSFIGFVVSDNLTLTAKWTPIEYTATFKADGNVIATEKFTVEDTSFDAPTCPAKAGYIEYWSSYSIVLENFTVEAVYTPITYSITFKVGNNTVKVCNFTVESTGVDEPDVPYKQCKSGAWEAYDFTAGNKTVNAVYTVSHENLKFINEKPATCNAAGNEAYYYCDGCDNLYSDESAKNLITGGFEVITIPKNTYCSLETLKFQPDISPTCTAAGIREHYKCEVCSKIYADALASYQINPALSKCSCNYVNGRCIWCENSRPSTSLSYEQKLSELAITPPSKQTFSIDDNSNISLYTNGSISTGVTAVIKSSSNEFTHIYADNTQFGKMLLFEGGKYVCETYLDIIPGPVNTATFFRNQSFVFEFDYMRGEADENGKYVNMSAMLGWRNGPLSYTDWGMLNFTTSGGLRLSEYGTVGRGDYGNTKEFLTAKGVVYNVAVHVNLDTNSLILYIDGVKWDECKFLKNTSDAETFGVTHIRFWCGGLPEGAQLYIDNYMHYASSSGPIYIDDNNTPSDTPSYENISRFHPSNYKIGFYGIKSDSKLIKLKHPVEWTLTKTVTGFEITRQNKTVGSIFAGPTSDASSYSVLKSESRTANGVQITKYIEQRIESTEFRYRYVYKYTSGNYSRTVTLIATCAEIDRTTEENLYSFATATDNTKSVAIGALSNDITNPSEILILGNSFISSSRIGAILTEMLLANEKSCNVTAISRGYANVATYANDTAILSSIREGNYDAVFICGLYSSGDAANIAALKSACDYSGTTLVIFPAHNESLDGISAAKSQYPSLYCLNWKAELDTLIDGGVDRWDLCVDDAHDHSTPLAGYVGAHMIYRAIYNELPSVPMRDTISQSYIDEILGDYAYIGNEHFFG